MAALILFIMRNLFNNFFPAKLCEPISSALGSIYGSAIGGGANLVSTAFNNFMNRSLAKKNMNWQSAEAEKQRQFTREMADLEWQRSDPKVQMERMKAAGLNPFISENAVPVGDSPHASTPAVPSTPPLPNQQPLNFDFLGQLVPLMLSSKKTESDILKNQSEALGEFSKTAAEIYKTYGKEAGDEFLKNHAPFLKGADYFGSDTNKLIQAEVKKQIAQADLQRTNADLEAKFGAQKAERIIWQFDQEYAESVARIGNINATNAREDKRLEIEIQEAAQRIVESCARVANLDAQTDQIMQLLPYLTASASYKSVIDYNEMTESESVSGSRAFLRRVRGEKWYQGMLAVNEGLSETGGTIGKMISDAIAKYIQATAAKGIKGAVSAPK